MFSLIIIIYTAVDCCTLILAELGTILFYLKKKKKILIFFFIDFLGLVSCCFVDSTCHQPVMTASSLQELGAMRNLTTCELDKRRHLVTDVRTNKRHLD